MGLKPLGIVKEIVEAAGMGISFVYEDLVFLNHNAFLLQFTDTRDIIFFHKNPAAIEQESSVAITRLKEEAQARDIRLQEGGYYTINQEEDDTIRLEISDPTEISY